MASETQAAAPVLQLASSLVRQATEDGAALRVCGSVGIRLLGGPGAALLERADRRYKDLDLVTRRQDRATVRQLLAHHQAAEDPQVRIASEGRRFAYMFPPTGTMIDLFVDELDFCHRLRLNGRLEETDLTLTPADLLLQKAQIVEITQRDQLDLVALLLTCPVGEEGEQSLSLARLGAVLAADWGFHHTVERNLARLQEWLPELAALSAGERRQVEDTIQRLCESLARMPKTVGYRLRSLLGTRVRWYNDVSDETRIF
jgi:hypothetical protein